jgi:hypothetical protein
MHKHIAGFIGVQWALSWVAMGVKAKMLLAQQWVNRLFGEQQLPGFGRLARGPWAALWGKWHRACNIPFKQD